MLPPDPLLVPCILAGSAVVNCSWLCLNLAHAHECLVPRNVLVSQNSSPLSMLCKYAGLPVRFNQTEVRVREDAGMVDIFVEVVPGRIHNLAAADLRVVEDSNNGGCLEAGQ